MMHTYSGLRGSASTVTFNEDTHRFSSNDAMIENRLNSVLDEEKEKPKRERRTWGQVLHDEFGPTVQEWRTPELEPVNEPAQVQELFLAPIEEPEVTITRTK